MFASLDSTGIYRSTDNGTTWTQTTLVDKYVNTIEVNGNNVFAGVENEGVYFSSNNGGTWSSTSLNNKSIRSLKIYGNYLFAGIISGGVYYTSNNGANWFSKNQGLPSLPSITSFAVLNNRIIASTECYSVFNRLFSEIIDVRKISTEIPARHFLSQNYPNPFNQSTKIKFDISSHFRSQIKVNEQLSIKVYDINGKEIETIVNGKFEPGKYEIVFDGSNLASGVYFYNLKTNDFSETKSMIIIK